MKSEDNTYIFDRYQNEEETSADTCCQISLRKSNIVECSFTQRTDLCSLMVDMYQYRGKINVRIEQSRDEQKWVDQCTTDY